MTLDSEYHIKETTIKQSIFQTQGSYQFPYNMTSWGGQLHIMIKHLPLVLSFNLNFKRVINSSATFET